MRAKETYTVVEAGFLLGDHYAAGATVDLYPEQAKWDLPPHGTMLRKGAPVAAPVKAPAKPLDAVAPRAKKPAGE